MRTLVVSDLHLGSRTDADVLRAAGARRALVAAVDGVERLVLLGDTLELRHGPVRDALEAARPLFEGIGAALPAGAQVVLVPGNHDHALGAPWLERRAVAGEPPLGLEQRTPGAEASEAVAQIARWLAPAQVDIAYPGLWLRHDVYATHGHFLDRHITIPTVERLAAGAMERVVGRVPESAATPEDYEAALAPLYAWLHVVARQARTGFGAERQRGTQSAWRILTATGRRPWRQRAFAAAFPFAVLAVNQAGIGPVGRDLSPQELRRAGLRAMAEVVRRLEVPAEWVLFGHTHRTGPLERDDPAEWRVGADGPRLMNTGSWVHEDVFLGPNGRGSPYWPGTVVELDADGPPRRRNLLEDWERPG